MENFVGEHGESLITVIMSAFCIAAIMIVFKAEIQIMISELDRLI